jgi:hypothetical protein
MAYSQMNLGLLEYLAGAKEAALADLRKAQALEPAFRKQLDEALQGSPELKPLRDDKEFLAKLFSSRP